MRVGVGADLGLSRASARLWAASVETTSVRWPSWAERTAVAAERLVLPDAALARVEDDPHQARRRAAGRRVGPAPKIASATLAEARAGRGRPPRTRGRGSGRSPASTSSRAMRRRSARRARRLLVAEDLDQALGQVGIDPRRARRGAGGPAPPVSGRGRGGRGSRRRPRRASPSRRAAGGSTGPPRGPARAGPATSTKPEAGSRRSVVDPRRPLLEPIVHALEGQEELGEVLQELQAEEAVDQLEGQRRRCGWRP